MISFIITKHLYTLSSDGEMMKTITDVYNIYFNCNFYFHKMWHSWYVSIMMTFLKKSNLSIEDVAAFNKKLRHFINHLGENGEISVFPPVKQIDQYMVVIGSQIFHLIYEDITNNSL